MANIEEVSGVFGGVKVNDENTNNVVENLENIENAGSAVAPEEVGQNLPMKTGFWNKLKSILFYEIKVELTPYQQKVEDEINEFLHQEITWGKVKDFLFQEVKFPELHDFLFQEITLFGKKKKEQL